MVFILRGRKKGRRNKFFQILVSPSEQSIVKVKLINYKKKKKIRIKTP